MLVLVKYLEVKYSYCYILMLVLVKYLEEK